MKNKNFSIKAKLLLAIIPITCAMIVALVIIAYNVSAMMIKQNATQLLETSVAKQGTSIENCLSLIIICPSSYTARNYLTSKN